MNLKNCILILLTLLTLNSSDLFFITKLYAMGTDMNEFDLKKLKIKRKQECDLDKTDRSSLRGILSECFPECFTDRVFYKQLPTMRLMAFYEKRLIGQVGIDHRVVSVNRIPYQIFGIVDLCVTGDFRSRSIGTLLLTALENLANQCDVNYVVAFADQHELYKKLGYKQVKANCRFLAIEDLSSHSIIERDESKILLIKSREDVDFTDKTIDLLGHLF
ncbi:MAG: GNAT family N-acetyltransferase [Alphaproteobacteria bacterium]|nr:GNAT family N-acetyltransferase [Alphaproteobacteria bacterium]